MKKEHPYFNLGGTTVVYKADVLGIFDLDTASTERDTKRYLKEMESAHRVVTVGYDLPKAFAITCDADGGHEKAYITTLASSSLYGRWNRQSKYL